MAEVMTCTKPQLSHTTCVINILQYNIIKKQNITEYVIWSLLYVNTSSSTKKTCSNSFSFTLLPPFPVFFWVGSGFSLELILVIGSLSLAHFLPFLFVFLVLHFLPSFFSSFSISHSDIILWAQPHLK